MLRETEFELLNYDEFLSTMKDVVKDMVGEKYSVEINHVIKNNSIELDGLAIFGEDIIITPNIYLNSYYERYMEDEDLTDLATEIVELYEATMEEEDNEVINISYELDEMKPFIICRLVNYKQNAKLLKEIPHIKFLDLAITFHCLVKDSDEGIGTIRITNEHLVRWDVGVKDLEMLALVNTPRLFPSQMRNMNEVIKEIFMKEMIEMPEEIDTKNKSEEMYVLTNIKGINGASCLLYPQVLQKVAEELDSDYYILPSSVHEVIIIKNNNLLDKNSLGAMVCDVNRTQVAADEVLSDHVYYYSKETRCITF